MLPCSLLDCPCDCQRRCLVPKSWLRSLALRRKGINIERQSHQAQVKRTIPYEAVCRCLQIVFRCCFCGWKKVEMVGIFFQACGDLDVLKSLEALHVVIDTLFRSKSSLHATSTSKGSTTNIPCRHALYFEWLFFSAFSKEFFPRPGSSEFVLPDAAVSVLRRWTCSIAFCYQLLSCLQSRSAKLPNSESL